MAIRAFIFDDKYRLVKSFPCRDIEQAVRHFFSFILVENMTADYKVRKCLKLFSLCFPEPANPDFYHTVFSCAWTKSTLDYVFSSCAYLHLPFFDLS
ncbi:hypothetical protein [Microvirus mar11]|uniref:Uncharacterized protein n=1 Tax=Microvirus mar11 TaxID=2851143 RepID=A0A8F5XPG2_9VIRU|nr:hypothetical protein [Microvirus mar11]